MKKEWLTELSYRLYLIDRFTLTVIRWTRILNAGNKELGNGKSEGIKSGDIGY